MVSKAAKKNQRANHKRRSRAAAKQAPLPPEVQARRAADREFRLANMNRNVVVTHAQNSNQGS